MTYTHVIDTLKDVKESLQNDDMARTLDCAIVLVSKMKRIHNVVKNPNGSLAEVKDIVLEE